MGAAEARRYCPPVRTTRVGMRPGQVYQLDDVWHDIRVLRPGCAGTGRPLEYCAMDLATAHKAAKFLRVEDEQGGKRERLKRWQLKAVVATLLCDVGFDPQGCTLVAEHGTAGLTDAEKDAVRAASAGLVEFRGGDILGRQVLAGAFAGQGHGNFRAKALLEGAHRLLHYEAAHLPGQTGGNSRADKPEGLWGLERLAGRIARIGETVPPEFRQLLWAGALPWATYQRLAEELEDAIDERTDHRLEGWEANGWTVAEWSPDGQQWRPAAEIPSLPPAMRAAAEAALRTGGLHRLRRMSPREAWNAGRGGLRRLPPWTLADFMGADCRVRAKVRATGLVEFQCRELFGDSETQRYLAEAETPGGGGARLRPLSDVDLLACPIWPWAVALDPSDGRVLGTLQRWQAASQVRPESMAAAAELAARVREGLNAPVRERHAEESAAMLAARESAEAILERYAPAAKKAKPAAAADLGGNAFRALEGTVKGLSTEQEEEEWK